MTPPRIISAQASRAPSSTSFSVRLDSIGQTKSLNHSSVGTSSATPRRVTIGAWVWQLISPGIATWPRASMRSAVATGAVVRRRP